MCFVASRHTLSGIPHFTLHDAKSSLPASAREVQCQQCFSRKACSEHNAKIECTYTGHHVNPSVLTHVTDNQHGLLPDLPEASYSCSVSSCRHEMSVVLPCRHLRCCRVGTCTTWAACETGCSRAALTTSPVPFAAPLSLSRSNHCQVSQGHYQCWCRLSCAFFLSLHCGPARNVLS